MNSQTLITYKLRYKTSNEGNDYILKCMKQYSSLLHYGYNRVIDGWSAKQIKDSMKSQLNNVELLDSHIISCVQQEASGIYKTGNNSWFYEDSDRAYWFNTLTEAKEYFQKINWTNGIKVPFDINTFKFMRGDVI